MQTPIYPPRCSNGHKLHAKSVYVSPDGKRWRCRQCLSACTTRYRKNRRAALIAAGFKLYDPDLRARATHCRKGHAWTEDNIYRVPSNPQKRQCMACRAIRYKARAKAASLQLLHELHPRDGFIQI